MIKKDIYPKDVNINEFLKLFTHYPELAANITMNLEILKTESIKEMNGITDLKNDFLSVSVNDINCEKYFILLKNLIEKFQKLSELYHLIIIYDISEIPKFVELKKDMKKFCLATKEILENIMKDDI